ncbi:hypothetical protein HCN44_011271 [Aphidius gifuensis]|uniref:G patch domain-containing protein 4 n=1 Tax=Aphidius gifuensis TaxID=684658 RepID=A0A834XWR9_APHGI|nr:hypothetical protein HCN44_011271 [Aphidius gifuensis]
MSDFAKSQLLKYGWSEGKGLGKNENGITEALKPKLKFDTSGVGHTDSEYKWWEFVYNKATDNVNINCDEGEVKMSIKDKNAVEIATSKSELNMKRLKNDTNINLHFGNFIKTSTLQDGKNTEEENTNRPMLNGDDDNDDDEFPKPLDDEALLKACGGRTAHKGARHGLTLTGKLARIQRQEEELLAKMSNPTSATSQPEPSTSYDWTTVERKKNKKSKKDNVKMNIDNDVEGEETSIQVTPSASSSSSSPSLTSIPNDLSSLQNTTEFKSKKTKLKDKRKLENLVQQMEKSLDLSTVTIVGAEKIKKKKKSKHTDKVNLVDDEITKKKKKKKSKKHDNDDETSDITNKKNKKKDIIDADTLNHKINKKKLNKLNKKANKKLDKISESLVQLTLENQVVNDVSNIIKKKKKKSKYETKIIL